MNPVPKLQNVGRRGLPREFVDRIHADYLRLRSCSKVAALHGRTRQGIHEILKTHQRARFQRKLKTGEQVRFHEGVKYTLMRGQWRAGNHTKMEGEVFLNRRVWAGVHGPIPKGMEIVPINGDSRDVRLENLEMKPAGAHSRRISGGQNQHTKKALEFRLEKYRLFVLKNAHQWHRAHPTVELQDLVQEGNLALMEAHQRFDPTKGANFMTYAAYWIRSYMKRFVAHMRDTIRIPEGQFGKIRMECDSLDRAVMNDSDTTLGEMIAAPEAEEQIQDDKDTVEMLKAALKRLKPIEQQVIKARFMDQRTLDDVSHDYGLTRERIRQIQNKALAKLRKNPQLSKAAA